MEDKAGPSSAAPVPQDPVLLAEADAKFEEGIACIKANNLEHAVQLFSEVLKVRTRHFGDLATECGSAYYRYGSALLYQAQDSDDVLGGPLAGGVSGGEGDDADEKENEDSGPASLGAAGSVPEGPAPSAADDKGKGKAPVTEPEDGEEGEDGGESDTAAESDLQLAWENLETAKFIWEQHPEQHTMQLADVHLLLGDVGMENEDFEGALADYEQSLGYLQKQEQEGSRRVAEVQYKRCMALQFLDRPQQALEAVKSAIECLDARAGQLKTQLEGGAEGEAGERAKAEQEDVAAVLGELSDKVEELQDVMEQHLSTKNALQSALEMITKQERGSSKAGQPSGLQKAAAAAAAGASGGSGSAPVEQEGFDKPASGDGSAAAAAIAAPAPVRDLGVVGRGTKRLNLAPVQVNATAGAAQEAPVTKKKRSLEDLLGGGVGKEGETTIGFGAAAPAAVAAAAPTATAAAHAALPAFLQPTAIQAVYGGEAKAGEGAGGQQ